jgi:Ser/Thr protein kinase RdoA (MazF antagonist)
MQPVFPTLYSTLSPDALASYISQHYALDGVQCQFIVRGVGDTYLVRSGHDRFILRIYRPSHRTLGNIQAEVELLLALKAADVSVSYPLADKDGHTIQALPAAEGIRHAVLFSYADGRSQNILTDTQLRNLGQEMARFHRVSSVIRLSDARWTFDLETTLYRPLAAAKDYFNEDTASYEWLVQTAGKVREKLSGVDTSGFAIGYCHYDFLPKNFHFDTADRITLFDFDFFGKGWLIHDIATFRQQLLLDRLMNRTTAAQMDHAYTTFLEAYQSERTLSEAELAAIPFLGLGFWIYYMGFHLTHDQFYPLTHPHVLQSRTGMIRKLIELDWDLQK